MSSQQPNTKPVLLVIDDEPEIREIIAFCAQDIGLHVLEAGDGAQALEIVRKQKVDIICSDLMMPRVTGITFLSHLRDEGRNQPFILITAFPSQDSTIQALRLGAFDYIEKPFDTDELKSLLQEALRVSSEYQRIEPPKDSVVEASEINTEEATDMTDGLGDARQVIGKLKALRYNSETPQRPKEEQNRVRELFVSEAIPQLVFCDAAIKNLSNAEHRAFELGYLFRVMQALSQAALAINEDKIGQFARTAEYLFTALRVQPRMVNERLIDLASLANGKLRDAITALGAAELPEGFEEIRKQLQLETEKLSGQVAA